VAATLREVRPNAVVQVNLDQPEVTVESKTTDATLWIMPLRRGLGERALGGLPAQQSWTCRYRRVVHRRAERV
jgi:hypothetical protein